MNREDWSEKNVAQKGFTLIELLVVIAILGILAVVGVLAFGGLTGSAHDATAKTEFGQVETAVSAYLAKDPANVVATLTPDPVAPLQGAGLLKNHPTLCTYTISTVAGVSTLTQGGPGTGCAASNTDTL
jgi:prepilin-type N-terminal cleavage/methylation domain-containing protein